MAQLIKQCCVCGTVYGAESLAGEKDKISHGYCSNDCVGHTLVQASYYDTKVGAFTLDQAYEVNNSYYLNGKEITRYIVLNSNMVFTTNDQGEKGCWEETITTSEDPAERLRLAREESLRWDMPIFFNLFYLA